MAPSRAIGLVLLSMAAFALSDMFVKFAAATLPVGQIVLLTGAGGLLIFAALALRAGDALISPAMRHPVVLARNAAEILAVYGMITALALAPLSLVAAITQVNPLLVTVGAALILKEHVGPRRWTAVLLGLAGVLIILRPDTGGASSGAWMALLAASALAARDLATRGVPPETSNLQLATWGFATVTLAGAVMVAVGGTAPVGPWEAFVVVAAMLTMALAYFAITAAMRTGEVSLVIPFRYARLLFATALGVVVFKERPDAATLIGAAIVIGAGLYVFRRERQVSQVDHKV